METQDPDAPKNPIGMKQLTQREILRIKKDTSSDNVKFLVESVLGKLLFKASVDKSSRSYHFNVLDSEDVPIFKIRNANEKQIFVSLRQVDVSVVHLRRPWFRRELVINDADDKPVLHVDRWRWPWTGDFTSHIRIAGDTKAIVGSIAKCGENYGVYVDCDLDASMKAAVIGSCMIMDLRNF